MTTQNDQKSSLTEFINESVHTIDDVDIGDVYAVSRNFIVVRRGFINIHHYYIPIKHIEGWDGFVLWLKITEKDVKEKYEKGEMPNPHRFFIKDYPYYTTRTYPSLLRLAPKYTPPTFEKKEKPGNIYNCVLCNEETTSEEALTDHVELAH